MNKRTYYAMRALETSDTPEELIREVSEVMALLLEENARLRAEMSALMPDSMRPKPMFEDD